MTLLDVQHVKKVYKTRFQGNQVEALKDIHFTVDEGDYVAIMGEESRHCSISWLCWTSPQKGKFI